MKRRYIAIEPHVADEPVCDSDRAIYWADEVDQRIAELEAERVSDDLLERLIGEIGENPSVGLCEYEQKMLDEAEAILAKRKGASDE